MICTKTMVELKWLKLGEIHETYFQVEGCYSILVFLQELSKREITVITDSENITSSRAEAIHEGCYSKCFIKIFPSHST